MMTRSLDRTAHWVEVIDAAIAALTAGTWQLCELMAQAKRDLGEAFYGVVAEVARRRNFSEKTLLNYFHVYEAAVEGGYLRTDLSLGHHNVVTRRALSPKDRAAFLEVAAQEGWSVGDLAARVSRILAPPESEDEAEEDPFEDEGAGEEAEPDPNEPLVSVDHITGIEGRVWLTATDEPGVYELAVRTAFGSYRYLVSVIGVPRA